MAADSMQTSKVDTKDDKRSLLYVKKRYTFGGYALHLLKEDLHPYLKSFVICSSCEGLLREACGVGDPQVFMCLSCAQERDSIVLKPNREAVDNLVLTCPLKSRGCAWEGKVSESEAHLDECEFFRIDCELLCGIVVERRNMSIHISMNCLHKEIQCEFCALSFKVKEVNIHQESCDEFPLQCPYQCGGVIKRKLMEHHVDQECENTVLECPYKEYGCEVEIARKMMEGHMSENRLSHLELKTESMYKQIQITQKENLSLKNELVTMRYFLSFFESKWVMRIGNLENMSSMQMPVANFIVNIPNDVYHRNVQIRFSCYKTVFDKLRILANLISYKSDPKLDELSTKFTQLANETIVPYGYDRSDAYLTTGLASRVTGFPEEPKNEMPRLYLKGSIVILNQTDQSMHFQNDFSVDYDIDESVYQSSREQSKVLGEFFYKQIMQPDFCVDDEILVHVYYNRRQNIMK